MASSENTATGNPILDNPGLAASAFALIVLLAFLGALYNSATSHHHTPTPHTTETKH